jgi:hypothetical protein
MPVETRDPEPNLGLPAGLANLVGIQRSQRDPSVTSHRNKRAIAPRDHSERRHLAEGGCAQSGWNDAARGNRVKGIRDEQTARSIRSRRRRHQSPRDRNRSLHIGDVRPPCDRFNEASIDPPEDVGSIEATNHTEVVQNKDEPQLGHVQNRMDIEVVLRWLVIARKQRGPENGTGPKPLIREDDVSAQVVPTGKLTERDDSADPFRLAVANAYVRSGIHLPMGEHDCHRISLSRAAASSGRVSARHAD